MHLRLCLGVVRQVGVHPLEHAELVGVRCKLWHQLGHPQAALAMLLKLPRRAEQGGAAQATKSPRLAIILRELWLVVEHVDMRGGAAHRQEDDALGARWEMRLLWGQRPGSEAGSLVLGARLLVGDRGEG